MLDRWKSRRLLRLWVEFDPQNPNYSLPYYSHWWVHYETVVALPRHCYLTYLAVAAGSSDVAVIDFLEILVSDFVEVNYSHLTSVVEGVVAMEETHRSLLWKRMCGRRRGGRRWLGLF